MMLAAFCAMAGAEELTLERALELANTNSPLLEESRAIQEGAGAGIVAARAYPNPQFNFMAGHQAARPVLNPGIPGLLQHYSASQPLEMPNVRRTRLQAAKLGLTSSAWGFASAQLGLRAHVKHAF